MALAINKICESFTQNLLTRSQGNPNFLSLMEIHKEFISNASEFNTEFGGGHHGWACFAMGDQQYGIHSEITFVPPRKPRISPEYPLNTTHGEIAVAEWQYHNNLHDYNLPNKMESATKKTVVTAIREQRIREEIDMLIGHANNSFMEFTKWI